MAKTQDVAEFAAQLARELPKLSVYRIGRIVALLMARGRDLHCRAEDACNGKDRRTGEPTDEAWDIRHVQRPLSRLTVALAKEGADAIRLYYSGDPRGCVLRLRLPSGRTNDFGGEGWAVPR